MRFYSRVLLGVLALTGSLHAASALVLAYLDVGPVSEPLLTGPFAVVYSWVISGLIVVALLLVWFRTRALAGAALLAGIAAWTLGLMRHVPQPSILLYLAPVAIGGLVLLIGLRYGITRLLPVSDSSQTREALALLRARIAHPASPTSGTYVGFEPGHDVALQDEKLERHLGGSVVITPCHQAVAVSDRLRLKGVRGPGLVLLAPGERVDQFIDLRPQQRGLSVTVRTKDGITVRVQASLQFQIDAGRRRPELGAPMPFSAAAAFKAVSAQRVEHRRGQESVSAVTRRLWDDLPAVHGEHVLRDLLSRLNFDELYAPNTVEHGAPRRRLARKLSERLQAELKPLGIRLIAVELGNFEPIDPDIYVRRARNWQTAWARRSKLTQPAAHTEKPDALERGRADASASLILDLGNRLEELGESEDETTPSVVLDQLLTVIESFASRPQVRKVLSDRTKAVLEQMREAVGE